MKIKEKLLDKINDEIKEIEDKIKDLTKMLKYHETEIKNLANDIVVYQTNHNIPSMNNHLTAIQHIETEIRILDDELCFLYILREDIEIDNEKEL